jgi:uncharacterized delta-60 repeat protein
MTITGLDPTFGTGGLALVDLQASTSGKVKPLVIEASVQQSDGKVIIVGEGNMSLSSGMMLVRYNADGTLDTTFGSSGVAIAPFKTFSEATSVAIAPGGKIVVGGFAVRIGLNEGTTSTFALARFNANGTLDTSFGTNGMTTTAFPGVGSAVQAIAVQPDGKIVAVGSGASSVDLVQSTISTDSGFAAARYNIDGSLDTSFGTGGRVTTSFAGSAGVDPTAIALQSNGAIVAVGLGYLGTNQGIAVARYTASGALDPSFNGSGTTFLPVMPINPSLPSQLGAVIGAVAIQADGKIVASDGIGAATVFAGGALSFPPVPSVARLNTNGSLDTSFGSKGLATVGLGADGGIGASTLTIQPNGQILAGGYYAGANSSSVGLFRLNPNGLADTAFGVGGSIVTVLGNSSFPAPAVLGIYPTSTGQLLVAVDQQSPTTSNLWSGLARYGLVVTAPTYNPAGNLEGLGKSSMAIYLPNSGAFAIRPANGGPDQIIPFGQAGPGASIPVVADYDGSGKAELAVYLVNSGTFAYRPAKGGPDVLIPFGPAGAGNSIPLPADYDGCGHAEIGVYIPSLGKFAYRPANGGPDVLTAFGPAGAGASIPVPGDYDGSGHTELAVYMPAAGAFAYRPFNGGPDVFVPFGPAGAGKSIPAPGDYDGSGHTEFAVYMPDSGTFAYRPAKGGADVLIPFGPAGAGASIPAPGDYDGSGQTEVAIYIPSLGAFAYRSAKTGKDSIIYFGPSGAGNVIPVNALT